MVTKFKYENNNGVVTKIPEYTFTSAAGLAERLEGVDNETTITSIVGATLKGEAERNLIEIEGKWFLSQKALQKMDIKKSKLEKQLTAGDVFGNPLNVNAQLSIKADIADLVAGTIVVKKEFYDHYTRKTYDVEEIHQTSYTKELERRTDLEASNKYLAGLRGVANTDERPTPSLSTENELKIRKQLVRQRISTQVGDTLDIVADMSNALSVLIKKVNGESVNTLDLSDLTQFIERKEIVDAIMKADYNK